MMMCMRMRRRFKARDSDAQLGRGEGGKEEDFVFEESTMSERDRSGADVVLLIHVAEMLLSLSK